jgi:hypothetical protein
VKLIEERHKKYKEDTKHQLSNKLIIEREKYEANFEKELDKRKKEEESKEEKIMKRYEGYVSNAYLILFIIVFYNESQKGQT